MPDPAIQAAKRRQALGIAAFLLLVAAGVSVLYHLIHADAVAYHRGELAYSRGDYAAALPHYREAHGAGLRSTVLHWHFATALIETGNPAEALPLLREVLAADPRNPAALAAAVGVSQAMGDPQTGLALYAALGPREKLPAADLLRLADLHQQAGQLDEAIACLRLAVEASPPASGADLRTQLGLLFARAGRRPEARAEFEAVLRLDPT
ncbi:MAG: tetratricopeptide repeat protein, partial [Burkholderiales bacterium]|nr:tetratricopeptide repeat protein [Opitutaceae bacterium]